MSRLILVISLFLIGLNGQASGRTVNMQSLDSSLQKLDKRTLESHINILKNRRDLIKLEIFHYKEQKREAARGGYGHEINEANIDKQITERTKKLQKIISQIISLSQEKRETLGTTRAYRISPEAAFNPSYVDVKGILSALKSTTHPSHNAAKTILAQLYNPDHPSYGHARMKYANYSEIIKVGEDLMDGLRSKLATYENIFANAKHPSFPAVDAAHPSAAAYNDILKILQSPDHPSHNISWLAYYNKGQGLPDPWMMHDDWYMQGFSPVVRDYAGTLRQHADTHKYIKKDWSKIVGTLESILPANHPSASAVSDFLKLLKSPASPSSVDAVNAYYYRGPIEAHPNWAPGVKTVSVYNPYGWPQWTTGLDLTLYEEYMNDGYATEIELGRFLRPNWSAEKDNLKLRLPPDHPSAFDSSILQMNKFLKSPSHPSYIDAVQAAIYYKEHPEILN